MTLSDSTDQVQRNRLRQAELYGEPLGERFRRIADRLGLNQARIAETVGLSPAMLSQLIGGRRIKIGNPAVAQRLAALEELAELAPGPGDDLDQRLAAIRSSVETGALTTTRSGGARPTGALAGPDSREVVRAIQDELRAAASAEELLAAVALLQPTHPRLAELLRVYGTGRTDAAMAHYRQHHPS